MHWATRSWLSEVAKGRCHRNRNIHRPEPPLHAAHTPGSDRRFCSLSCARSQTPCRDPPFPRRLAGEPRTAAFHPSPNTPSTASLPPKKQEKVSPMCPVRCVTYVSGRSPISLRSPSKRILISSMAVLAVSYIGDHV